MVHLEFNVNQLITTCIQVLCLAMAAKDFSEEGKFIDYHTLQDVKNLTFKSVYFGSKIDQIFDVSTPNWLINFYELSSAHACF